MPMVTAMPIPPLETFKQMGYEINPDEEAKAAVRRVGPGKWEVKWPGHEHLIEYPWSPPTQEDEAEARQTGRSHGLYKPQWYQWPYHTRSHRLKLFVGANDTGKSVMGRAEVIWLGEGVHPWQTARGAVPPVTIRVSVTEAKLFEEYMRGLLEGFMSRVDGQLVWQWTQSKLMYLHKTNGSRIFIKSDEQAELTGEASRLNLIWLDEAHSPQTTKASVMRTVGLPPGVPHGQVLITCTGLAKAEWMQDEWIEPHEKLGRMPHLLTTRDATGREFISMMDNQHLRKEDVEDAKQTWTGRDYEVRVMGKIAPRGVSPVFSSELLYNLRETAVPGERGRLVRVSRPADAVAEMRMATATPHERESLHWQFIPDADGPMERWGAPLPQHEYVIVGDPSSGRDLDEMVWEVFDIDACTQEAEWSTKQMNMLDYADEGLALGWHYNVALLVVLHKGVGEGVAHSVVRPVDRDGEMIEYPNLYRNPNKPEIVGISESLPYKKEMVARASVFLRGHRLGLRSPVAIGQFQAFSYSEGGAKIGTRSGRDDRCIPCMVAVMFCVDVARPAPAPVSTQKSALQVWLKNRIDELAGAKGGAHILGATRNADRRTARLSPDWYN